MVVPYIALTATGVIFSYSGKAGCFTVLTWPEVRERLTRVHSRFTLVEDFVWKLGIELNRDRHGEFKQALEERLAEANEDPDTDDPPGLRS